MDGNRIITWAVALFVCIETGLIGWQAKQIADLADKIHENDKRLIAIESSRFDSKDGLEMAKLLAVVSQRIDDLQRRIDQQ